MQASYFIQADPESVKLHVTVILSEFVTGKAGSADSRKTNGEIESTLR